MLPCQWAFVAGAVIFGGLGVLLGQWLAWWFLFPRYVRPAQPKRRDKRGRWS